MLMQFTSLFAYSLLSTLKTSANAARYADEITSAGLGSLMTLELMRNTYPPSLILTF